MKSNGTKCNRVTIIALNQCEACIITSCDHALLWLLLVLKWNIEIGEIVEVDAGFTKLGSFYVYTASDSLISTK